MEKTKKEPDYDFRFSADGQSIDLSACDVAVRSPIALRPTTRIRIPFKTGLKSCPVMHAELELRGDR